MLSSMVGYEHPPLYLLALAGPLGRQQYQATLRMHILASAIVSWFRDCIWVGSPGGAVSALYFVSLHFLLNEAILGLNF